ncbi:hypothetical protein [Enterobacter ludwigii]
MPAIAHRHRPVVSLVRLAGRDQGQNPHFRSTLFGQLAGLFFCKDGSGQRTAGIRQLHGQLHVLRTQGAQPARGFHAPAGGAQVRPVYRTMPPVGQQTFNEAGRHGRSGMARLEGGQHNQHPALQR